MPRYIILHHFLPIIAINIWTYSPKWLFWG